MSASCDSSSGPAGPTRPKSECVDVDTHSFKVPERKIFTPDHMPAWQKSMAYADLTGFILAMNESVKDKKISDNFAVPEIVHSLVTLLDEMDVWIDDIPPINQPQRFGNKAFRHWHLRLCESVDGSLRGLLPQALHLAVAEVSVYLKESFGNSTRIDYGTGHELSFVAFLCCLCKVGVVVLEVDLTALCLLLFNRYMQLVRRLQMTYRMEPAGSHGVWSLDDYQFLSFLWGSAQLLNNKRILPKSFVEPDIYGNFSKDYLFLSAISHIDEVKTGPFAEHSNQLWNISAVPSWSKVNTGLFKMYKVEVLGKFPVVQHFLFGSLLTLDLVPAGLSKA